MVVAARVAVQEAEGLGAVVKEAEGKGEAPVGERAAAARGAGVTEEGSVGGETVGG